MKKPTPLPRASHVNFGTSVPHEDLPWPDHNGTVLRHGKVHVEQDARPDVTNLGGLILPFAFMRRFKVARVLDERVQVLKFHLPYHESDHIITQALMLYADGTCIEDMAMLQQDTALLKLFGAVRTPDPTTAGDFLRRFVPKGELENLRGAIDEIQNEVWVRSRRWRWKRLAKRPLAVLHLDGHTKDLYGVTKEGADFSYDGRWSYSVLLATLQDGEWVAGRLRSGNHRSSDGAAELLDEVLPRLLQHYEEVLVVADSDYDRADVRYACDSRGCYFAFVGRETKDRPGIAAACENWRPFRTRAHRMEKVRRGAKGFVARGKRRDLRRKRARARGYKDIKLTKQDVDETAGPDGARLVIRRQHLEVEEGAPGQRFLWEQYRFRYVVTNLPRDWTIEDVLDETYKRCDQENVIAGLGSGIAAWRMPVAEMRGNAAWLEIARLAWNLGKWIAREVLRGRRAATPDAHSAGGGGRYAVPSAAGSSAVGSSVTGSSAAGSSATGSSAVGASGAAASSSSPEWAHCSAESAGPPSAGTQTCSPDAGSTTHSPWAHSSPW